MKKDGLLSITAGMAAGCTALILAVFLFRIGAAVIFPLSSTASDMKQEGDILCVCFPFWSVFTKNADIYIVKGDNEAENEEMLKDILKVLDLDMLKGQDRVSMHETDMDRLDFRYSMLKLILPRSEHRYDEYVQSPDTANFHYFRFSGFR